MGLSAVPSQMSYGEAWRLAHVLMSDPSSQSGAVVAGWQYPLSREGIAVRDLYDMQHASKTKRKPQAYPRPWDVPAKTTGAGTSLTIAEFKAVKAALAESSATPPQPRDALGRYAKRI